MPHKRRSTLEAERLRLERLRKRAADREYNRKKYPACPHCGQHHEPKAHEVTMKSLRPSIAPEDVSADRANTSENDSTEKSSTDSTTESTGEKTSEDSSSTQTED